MLCLLMPLNGSADRYDELTREIRCMVCDNQSIADSNAPLAKAMRAVVASKIREGESDQAILLFMKKRYGDDVLYNPPLTMRTLALWLLPVCMFIAVLYFVMRISDRVTSNHNIR